MATFITTLHFTEQGLKGVRDTCNRAARFKSAAEKLGIKVTGIYWKLGAFGGVIFCEATADEPRFRVDPKAVGSRTVKKQLPTA